MTELQDAVDGFPIVSWCEDHFQNVVDNGGENFTVDCPICNGKQKLGINRYLKVFHCFRCDDVGDHSVWNGKANLIQMIMLTQEKNFPQARDFIMGNAGIPDTKPPERIIPKFKLPRNCVPIKESPHYDAIINYLEKRDVAHLKDRSLYCGDPVYCNYIIFPVTRDNEVIGFEAKAFNRNKRPKTLYPAWLDTAKHVYTSSKFSYIQPKITITESILDAETLSTNGIGIFGSTLGEGQVNSLLELKQRFKNHCLAVNSTEEFIMNLYWMLDWDAMLKGAKQLLKKTFPFFDNYICNMPQGTDPNELGTKHCRLLHKTAIKVDSEYDLLELFM